MMGLCDNCNRGLEDTVWQDKDGEYCGDCAREIGILKDPTTFSEQEIDDATINGETEKLREIISFLLDKIEELSP